MPSAAMTIPSAVLIIHCFTIEQPRSRGEMGRSVRIDITMDSAYGEVLEVQEVGLDERLDGCGDGEP